MYLLWQSLNISDRKIERDLNFLIMTLIKYVFIPAIENYIFIHDILIIINQNYDSSTEINLVN